MPKSIIEQEIEPVEKYFELVRKALINYKRATMTFDEFLLLLKTRELEFNSAIQKALKELEKKKYGVPPYDVNSSLIDKKTEVVKWSDVEKCFGQVKDAKIKFK